MSAGPVLFFGLLFSVAAGISVNVLSARRLRRWWQQLLAVLAGLLVTLLALALLGSIVILRPGPGPFGLGEAIGALIAMGLAYVLLLAIGAAFYLLSSALTSVVRRLRRKALKAQERPSQASGP